ncbi:MAG: hypothetical protein BRD55_01000 [Bacteroidetes bacterium SW_9_63_38]|nr:MAG: hypothetical protein BRD55_01000 [Bacteroidetes bacterium SW_9_63_38]
MADASTPLPGSTPASPVPNSVVEAASPAEEQDPDPVPELDLPETVPDVHRDVVRRLHRKIQAAVSTIEALRTENERLRERVEELEAEPEFPDNETVFALDDDPEDVREQITQFINTIDTYLETTVSTEAEAAPDDPDL